MSENKTEWKPGKRDLLALTFVIAVITVLSLGVGERNTAATPDNMIHRTASSRAACLSCHGPEGVRPQPPEHAGNDQCFLCHKQPPGWKGASQ